MNKAQRIFTGGLLTVGGIIAATLTSLPPAPLMAAPASYEVRQQYFQMAESEAEAASEFERYSIDPSYADHGKLHAKSVGYWMEAMSDRAKACVQDINEITPADVGHNIPCPTA